MVTYDVHWVFVRQESIILYTQPPFIAKNVTLSCRFKKRLSYKYSETWIKLRAKGLTKLFNNIMFAIRWFSYNYHGSYKHSFPLLGKQYYCYTQGRHLKN